MALVCITLLHQPVRAHYYFYNDKYLEQSVVFEIGATGGIMNSLTDSPDDTSAKSYIDPSLFKNFLIPNQVTIAQKLYERQSELTPGNPATSAHEKGYPEDNDSYFTIQFKIGLVLDSKENKLFSRYFFTVVSYPVIFPAYKYSIDCIPALYRNYFGVIYNYIWFYKKLTNNFLIN